MISQVYPNYAWWSGTPGPSLYWRIPSPLCDTSDGAWDGYSQWQVHNMNPNTDWLNVPLLIHTYMNMHLLHAPVCITPRISDVKSGFA